MRCCDRDSWANWFMVFRLGARRTWTSQVGRWFAAPAGLGIAVSVMPLCHVTLLCVTAACLAGFLAAVCLPLLWVSVCAGCGSSLPWACVRLWWLWPA
jgi:hypothetical protein